VTIYRRPSETRPCRQACPAGIDVPRHVRLVTERQFDKALEVIGEKIPFASVCGRICFHPYEQECNLNKIGETFIHSGPKAFPERLGSSGEELLPIEPSGKGVAIVGSGPGVLTASYYFIGLGHRVTIFES
jgi:formate dehydrogenase beta subunit